MVGFKLTGINNQVTQKVISKLVINQISKKCSKISSNLINLVISNIVAFPKCYDEQTWIDECKFKFRNQRTNKIHFFYHSNILIWVNMIKTRGAQLKSYGGLEIFLTYPRAKEVKWTKFGVSRASLKAFAGRMLSMPAKTSE